MDILNFTETPIINESIEEYQYHEYESVTGTNLNNPWEIRFHIETQNLFTHPSESYLIVEGRLVISDTGGQYDNLNNITLQTMQLCMCLVILNISFLRKILNLSSLQDKELPCLAC